MNSFTIGHVQSLLVSTMTNNQCAFSDTFTTLRASGLSQHPADTSTSLISINGDGTIAVGGFIANSLPAATPFSMGVLYGTPPNSSNDSSLSLGYSSQAAGTWSIAIGNNILTNADNSIVCNVAVGSSNFYSLTTGHFNTAISQNSSTAITTGDYNMTIGYEAGGGGNGFVTRNNNIANGDSSGNSTNDAAATNNIYIYWPKHWYQLHWCI